MTREKKNHVQQFGSCAHLHIEALISPCEQWAECDHGVQSVEVIGSTQDGGGCLRTVCGTIRFWNASEQDILILRQILRNCLYMQTYSN